MSAKLRRCTLVFCLATVSLPLRLAEALSIGAIVYHVERMATLHGPKLVAGTLVGFVVACLFLLLHSLVDRALLCSAYVAVYCYACGASVAAITRTLGCFAVSRAENIRCIHNNCSIGRKLSLDDPHYTGLLIGLLFCFSTITVRTGRADPANVFIMWCRPHDHIHPIVWGLGWGLLGIMSTQLSFVTQAEHVHRETDPSQIASIYAATYPTDDEEEEDAQV